MRKVIVRDLQPQDIIDASPDFPIPDRENGLYFSKKVVEVDGKVAGFGFLKVTSEAMLIPANLTFSGSRALVMKELIQVMNAELDKFGLEDCHVFLVGAHSGQTEEFLKKHFSFIDASGKCLYLPPKG